MPDRSASGQIPSTGYVAGLDGLRAVAVFLVMLRHLVWNVVPGGWIGVDVFFVLSGFLITHLLLVEWSHHGVIRLGKFWLRRALRLVPCLYAFLLVWLLVCWWRGTLGENLPSIGLGALYLMNFAAIFGISFGSLAHLWSLGVEEQFYIVWPLLLILVILRLPRRFQAATVLGLALAVTAGRTYHVLVNGHIQFELGWNYIGITRRADTLLIGCALAFALAHRGPAAAVIAATARRLAWPAVGLLAVFAAVAEPFQPMHQILLFPLIYMTAAVLVAALVVDPSGSLSRVFSLPPVVYVGRISYGIYVWHVFVFSLLWPVLQTAPLMMLVGIPASILVASLSYWVVERPFLALKQRIASPSS